MENYKNSLGGKSFNFFLPIAFILSIIPLIVRMKLVDLDEVTSKLTGTTTQFDLFSQRKAFFLMIFSILLVVVSIIFFKKIFSKKDKIVNLILIFCGIFFLFTLLSAILSNYKEVSLYGMFDRAEGLITITCYMVLFIYSIYTFKTTKDYKYVVIPLLILVAVNSFLGLFQYVGQDLIKTQLGISITIPSDYKIDPSKLNLSNGNSIYGTLFNSNYVGSFAAMVLPILFCLTIFEDDVINKITLFIGTALSVWLLFGSNARSGLIGIFISIVFGCIVFWKLLAKRKKGFFIIFVAILILLIGTSLASHNFRTKITDFSKDIVSIFSNTSDFDYREHVPIKDIKHVDKSVQVVFTNNILKISHENNGFEFRNSMDEVIQFVSKDKKMYTTDNATFKNISFQIAKFDNTSTTADTLILYLDNVPQFAFRLKPDNSVNLIDLSNRQYIDLETPESFGFKGKELLGSGRGYIWSRSIPLLKDNIILGSGPDTFIFRFPQHDLIGKLYALGSATQTVDKPHNLYLQIAIDYGIIALIGFIAMMIIYLVDSFKLYALKKDYEKSQILGAVTSFGVIGYLFAGIFNDSVVSVAPIFWIILGVGVSLNYMNRKATKK